MQNVLVVGLGKVGSLVGTLLAKRFKVTGVDKKLPEYTVFDTKSGDVSNHEFLEQILEGHDAVVSCMPYYLNLPIATAAFRKGIHYFDLTEDVNTTAAIREMAKSSRSVMAPQCGLAPGFIGIVGTDLTSKFTKNKGYRITCWGFTKVSKRASWIFIYLVTGRCCQ